MRSGTATRGTRASWGSTFSAATSGVGIAMTEVSGSGSGEGAAAGLRSGSRAGESTGVVGRRSAKLAAKAAAPITSPRPSFKLRRT